MLAVAIETGYSRPEIEEPKDRIANADQYVSATVVETKTEAPAAEAEKEPEKDDEDENLAARMKALEVSRTQSIREQ